MPQPAKFVAAVAIHILPSVATMNSSTKMSMAEEEVQEKREQDVARGVKRRSSRQRKQVIATAQLRRVKELFFDGDSLYQTAADAASGVDADENQNQPNDNQKRPRRSSRSRSTPSSSLSTAAAVTPSSVIPLSTVSFGGRMRLQKVHDSPHVYVVDEFLTQTELAFVENKIAGQKTKFSKSFVDDASSGKSALEPSQRTSTFCSFGKLENRVVAGIERKAAELLGLSVDTIEPLQLVRYQVNQFFGVHHDLGVLFDDGSVELPAKQPFVKRRLVTIFCYVNDVPDKCGGCTYFPQLNSGRGLRVAPKKGRAVVFCNITKDGVPDTRTIHAGEPVLLGGKKAKNKKEAPVKYGINIWACEE